MYHLPQQYKYNNTTVSHPSHLPCEILGEIHLCIYPGFADSSAGDVFAGGDRVQEPADEPGCLLRHQRDRGGVLEGYQRERRRRTGGEGQGHRLGGEVIRLQQVSRVVSGGRHGRQGLHATLRESARQVFLESRKHTIPVKTSSRM